MYPLNYFSIIISRINKTRVIYLCTERQLYIEFLASCGVYNTRLKNSDSKGIFVSKKKGDDSSARKHLSLWILSIKCPGINVCLPSATNPCYNTWSKEIVKDFFTELEVRTGNIRTLSSATWWLATLFFKWFNIMLIL